jgi:hypothetical protein
MSSAGVTVTRARAVSPALDRAAGHDDGLAGAGLDGAAAEAERHLALEDLEALLLMGMDVHARDLAVGRELELDLQALAVRVGRGGEERDALAADGVLDDLTCIRHGNPCPSWGGLG